MGTTTEVFESIDVDLRIAPARVAEVCERLAESEQAAAACSVAMIAEEGMADETRLALDSIDVIQATRAVLTRASGTDKSLQTLMLEAVIAACQRCADACGKHAQHNTHCRLHSESSQRAADASRRALAELRG